jgi:hypothetical protein
MAGACSGCAMSKKTLQEGVERLLTHYVPEVIGLLSEDDEEATSLLSSLDVGAFPASTSGDLTRKRE